MRGGLWNTVLRTRCFVLPDPIRGGCWRLCPRLKGGSLCEPVGGKKLLSRSYGPVQALDRVSFTLEPGEILGVAGESGCGKSTLLRLISGLEPPDTGKLLLRDRRCLPGAAGTSSEPCS